MKSSHDLIAKKFPLNRDNDQIAQSLFNKTSDSLNPDLRTSSLGKSMLDFSINRKQLISHENNFKEKGQLQFNDQNEENKSNFRSKIRFNCAEFDDEILNKEEFISKQKKINKKEKKEKNSHVKIVSNLNVKEDEIVNYKVKKNYKNIKSELNVNNQKELPPFITHNFKNEGKITTKKANKMFLIPHSNKNYDKSNVSKKEKNKKDLEENIFLIEKKLTNIANEEDSQLNFNLTKQYNNESYSENLTKSHNDNNDNLNNNNSNIKIITQNSDNSFNSIKNDIYQISVRTKNRKSVKNKNLSEKAHFEIQHSINLNINSPYRALKDYFLIKNTNNKINNSDTNINVNIDSKLSFEKDENLDQEQLSSNSDYIEDVDEVDIL